MRNASFNASQLHWLRFVLLAEFAVFAVTIALAQDSPKPSAAPATNPADDPAANKVLFYDDFEKGDVIDPKKWTVEAGYDPAISLSVQSQNVSHGKNAAHAYLIEKTGGLALLKETATFPALADGLWGRVYFYTAIADGAGHTGFISAYAKDQRVLEIGVSQGKWQLTYYEPGKEFPVGYEAKVPRNKWVCLEWHFTRTGSHLIEVYIDGKIAATYDASGHTPPPFTALSLGMDNHSANPPGNDVYLDDIAIDANRVGCRP